MSSDLTKKCRTCMQEDNCNYQLHDIIEEEHKILEMLDGVVPQIQIKTESTFSSSICLQCVDKLLVGYKFQRLCIETDNHFRRLVGLSPLLEDDLKPETVWDPLEETILDMKVEIDDDAGNKKDDDAEETLKSDNDLEGEGVGGTDDNATDSSNENLNVLKAKSLRISLKIGNYANCNNKSNSKEFPCSDCGKTFGRLSRLKAHGSVHARKRAYKCSICNYSFATEKTYTAHKKRHKNSGQEIQCLDNGEVLPEGDTKEKDPPLQVGTDKIQDSPHVFEQPIEQFIGNEEWLHSEDDSIDFVTKHSRKKSASKPEHGKNVDFVDTGIGEIEKPNSKNRRNGNFPCEVCGKIFDRPFRLKRHSSVHSLDKPYACEICKCRFSTASYLRTHKMLHQNKSSDGFLSSQAYTEGFKCPDCPRRFEKQTSLSAHRQIHTRDAFTASYSCSVCLRNFMSVKTLTEHVTNKHPDAKKHTCDQCDKSFVLHAHLLEHLNRHKGNKNLVCVICEKEFGFMSTLKEHMRIHSGESPYLCPECGKTFRNGSNLRQHMERHSGLKKYQCPDCPSRFNCRSDLKKHIDTHNSIRSYECDTCGSRFTRSYSLQKHKRLHLGKRPYKCDQCNMTFALLYHLRRHMRTHTGERPFKCKYCERAYGERGDLNKHLRTHVGENTYMCDQCPKAFKYQSELRQHHSEHYKISQQTVQKSEHFPQSTE